MYFPMSYPYGQYPGENFSNPATPSLDAFPAWETVEHEEQQSRQEHQPRQHTQQQRQSELPSPTAPPQQYQTIQLEEPTHIVPSHPVPAHDDTPVRLRQPHPSSERRRESLRDSESRILHVDTTRSSSALAMPGPVRQARPQQHQQVHPYRRPPSATGSVPSRQREQMVRFASVQPPSSSSMSMPSPAMPSPAAPSPGSATSRLASFGSAIGSPMLGSDNAFAPTSSRRDAGGDVRRFIIRTDSNYDPSSKVLTTMLELPGVKKADVRVTLSTCHYNRVKQITVSGHSTPVFPSASMSPELGPGGELTIRERKFGEFARTFAVPSDIKREDIEASMEDGVLTVKVPCGMPVHPSPEDIPVR